MQIKKIWLCTSKYSKLNRLYLIPTGQEERNSIYSYFQQSLNYQLQTEQEMNVLNGNALVEDIPYYIDVANIDDKSYLEPIKLKITEILSENAPKVVSFKKNPLKQGEIKNIDDNEGIKFIVAQTDDTLYFLSTAHNAILKNKLVINLSITENSTLFDIPKGVQIPSTVTARFHNGRLYVYDVNRFESMLALNENRKAKSIAILKKFMNEEYKIAEEEYVIRGLDNNDVQQSLYTSGRAVRRLSKYFPSPDNYSIEKIKQAVNKLDPSLRVAFDDNIKAINVTPETAKTFVAIIHNTIIQRLISGEIEIAI